jgi:hypothetical protein
MTLTTVTVLIAFLGVLVGYVAQAVNTGSLFGIVTVPKTWLPYLALAGTFLAAFVQSIATATTVNGTAWINALLAGMVALGGNATGITISQHLATASAKKAA